MYWLNSPKVRASIEAQSSGTTRKRVTGNKLKSLPVRVPPSNEQKRIASRVDELFSSIEEGERVLERVRRLIELYRQSVLKAAVTGGFTRDWREQHGGRFESGKALLNDVLAGRRANGERVGPNISDSSAMESFSEQASEQPFEILLAWT